MIQSPEMFFHTAYNIIIIIKKEKKKQITMVGNYLRRFKLYGDVGFLTDQVLFSSGTASYHHFTNDFIQNDSEDFVVVIVGFDDAYLADENRLKIVFEIKHTFLIQLCRELKNEPYNMKAVFEREFYTNFVPLRTFLFNQEFSGEQIYLVLSKIIWYFLVK